jgi:epoxide hydrolase-like predicted phosphatase
MHTHPSIRAIIFDMGGVLVRNMAPEPRSRLATRYGLTAKGIEDLVFGNPVARKASMGEVTTADNWEYVRQTLNLDPNQLAEFIQNFWASDRLDEELHEFVRSLRPRYKTGLLSNAFDDARSSLSHRFPRFFDAFDISVFSAEAKMAKPDERFYCWILDRLGVSAEEAIFVDDFVENIEGAQALGMQAVLFKNSQQARQAILEKISSNGAE